MIHDNGIGYLHDLIRNQCQNQVNRKENIAPAKRVHLHGKRRAERHGGLAERDGSGDQQGVGIGAEKVGIPQERGVVLREGCHVGDEPEADRAAVVGQHILLAEKRGADEEQERVEAHGGDEGDE